MKVSLNWLKELANAKTITANNLANTLTQAGFEVEAIESISLDDQIDYILEISSTANRSDALSMIGLSREVAALTKSQILEEVHNPFKDYICKTNNLVSDHNLLHCNNYFSAIMDNLIIKDSPIWLKNRLKSSGFVSKNLLIDISNYIMLKWGQPISIIDFNKIIQTNNHNPIIISSDFCSLKNADINLDNNNIKLSKDILVTQINDSITSVAGIGTNSDFNIEQNTQLIFIEAAVFKQAVIRKSSRTLGIRTESSTRQERGLNTDNWENAYLEALSLIFELANGKIRETFYKKKQVSPVLKISLSLKKVQDILGPVSSSSGTVKFLNLYEIENILKSLNFHIIHKNPESIIVSVPNYRRQDIIREIDIIEEVARIYGYHKFRSSIPCTRFTKKSSEKRKFRDKGRSVLRNLGFTELVHYSLVKSEGSINLNNPLIQDYSILRCSLLEGLIQSNIHNLRQSNQTVDSFEVGTVFEITSNKITETTKLAIILGGNLDIRSEWSEAPHALNWYEAKGILENFFYKINRQIEWTKTDTVDNYSSLVHKRKSATLIYDNNTIGLFGELNQLTCSNLGLKTKLFVLEIDLNILERSRKALNYLNYQVKPYSKYPSITRDLSIIVPKDMETKCLFTLLDQFQDNELENTTLFDQYSNTLLGKNKKSIGLRFTYRSNHKTLTNLEIDNKQNLLQEKIIQELNLEIRQ